MLVQMLVQVMARILVSKFVLFGLACLVAVLYVGMWDAVVCMMHTSILLYTYFP